MVGPLAAEVDVRHGTSLRIAKLPDVHFCTNALCQRSLWQPDQSTGISLRTAPADGIRGYQSVSSTSPQLFREVREVDTALVLVSDTQLARSPCKTAKQKRLTLYWSGGTPAVDVTPYGCLRMADVFTVIAVG